MLISKARKSRLVLMYASPCSCLNRSCNFTICGKFRTLAFNFIDVCQLVPLKAIVVGTCGAECSNIYVKKDQVGFFSFRERKKAHNFTKKCLGYSLPGLSAACLHCILLLNKIFFTFIHWRMSFLLIGK